ncbi:MAG: Gfo/Idh/MocA family oxidoreductase [Gemmatimonadota bacterium]|nr:MAG: Gfo/Idh/MocA family oxidoreductase [Gemmatimonadota bacterium]
MRTGSVDPVRVGIIGTGAISQIVHLPILTERPDVTVAGVCDIDQPKAEAIAERFGVANVVMDEGIITDPDVDAVIICTPTHQHERLAVAALEAGKHVLVERPVALTAEATENVVNAARESGRFLMVGLSHRFRADAGALAAFVAGGELGTVFAVFGSSLTRRMPFGRITWRQQQDEAGGGALMDLGVPALDLAFWMVGYPKIKRVSAVTRTGEVGVEDSATVLAVSENGIAFNIDVSWSLFAEADQHSARVMGTEGSGSLPPLHVHKQLGGRPMNVTPRQPKPRGGENLFTNAYRRLLDEFVRGISGHCEIPLPVDQIELMKVVEAAYRSAREQCEVAL